MSLIRRIWRVLAWAAMPLYFGGDGGSSSSSNSTTTNTTNYTTTTNTDKRQVVDTGSVGVSSEHSTVNVTQTDYQSIANAIDLAKSGNASVSKNLESVLGLAKGALTLSQEAAGTVGDAYKNVAEMSTGQKQLATAAIAIVGAVAAFGLFGKRKAG